MTETLRGGCACGQVRYEVDTAPASSLLCMCRQCQRISGSGHSAQFAAMAAGTRIHGVLRYHDYAADSGNTVSCGFVQTAAIRC